MKDPLSITHPQIATQWHPTRNGELTPDRVVAGSHKKAWWICFSGSDHEWEAVIKSRTNGCGCPFCSGLKASVTNSLANLYPEIAKDWHPTKNGTLTPDQVVAGSEKKAWWICPNGSDHEWNASIRHRAVDGSGCPFCAGKKPSVTNSLASLYPEIAQQWHPTKNGTLTPDQVVAGSNKKAWWICSNNPEHEWEAIIGNRAKGVGCPYCANQKPSTTNSLAKLYPEISKQWHPAKNGTLTPAQVVAGSNKKAWWICPKGSDHEWEAKIGDRVKGNGCPFCRSLRPSITNSLAKLYPEIAKQWHPAKNGTLTPDQVVAGSEKKAWWICPKGSDHEWEAMIYSRASGTGCPFCAGQRVSVTNSLASLHPEIAAQWHPRKNGTLTPEQVTTGTSKKVWWKCPNGSDHEWEASIDKRTSGRGCPFCSGGRASVTNSLASLYPEIAKQWHPQRNGTFTPEQVTPGSGKKAWWKCSNGSDHEWEERITDRVHGKGCLFCNGLRPSITNSLASLYPEIAKQWHPKRNGVLTPEQVIVGSNQNAWWKCSNGSDHEWEARIADRVDGKGCPFCAGLKPSVTNSLASLYPEIAKQWHPTKNGNLTPDRVVAGSEKKAWWICPKQPDHQWKTLIVERVNGSGCPFCLVPNSLASLYPDIAQEWHPEKNEALTPQQVTVGSPQKAWWKCPKGSDHEWEASIANRVNGTGCPFCAGRQPSVTNSLASLYPEIAKQWHPKKNGSLTPDRVVAGSGKKAWWKCPNSPDHEWEAVIGSRVNGTGCPFCAGRYSSITNSLDSLYPDVAAQWHPTKNGTLTPDRVTAGSGKKVWWKCPKAPDHEWEASISNKVKGRGCPCCAGYKVSLTNSLASLYPDISKQWHPTKNGDLTPDRVVAGSNKKAWWKCPNGPDHEWEASIVNRTRLGNGCVFCAGYKTSVTNSLASLYPEVAKEWHPTKNGIRTPDQVVAGSPKKAWWRCSMDLSHEWEAAIISRTKIGAGCPACNQGWTMKAIRGFAASLINHLGTFTPAELYLLFQQNGMLQTQGKGKGFVKALSTGRFPAEEIEKFVNGEPSIVDKFLQDKQLTLEALETSGNNDIPEKGDVTSEDNLDDQIDETVEPSEEEYDLDLPVVQTREVLASLDHSVISSADEEAVEFLIASAKAKIWKHVFRDEAAAVAQAQNYTGDSYAEKVKSEFLDEYHRAKNLPIPTGYNFRINGKIAEPNLMQRLAAVQVRDKKRVGNWSGTGAGKTLSAVLASRVINAHLTVICCPNSVVDGWEKAILDIFPNSVVAKKTFTPDWKPNPPASSLKLRFPARKGEARLLSPLLGEVNVPAKEEEELLPSPRRRGAGGEVNHYLILNYEMFQQPNSANWVRTLINNQQIDFIVIDEIHYTKQRQAEDISKRKQLISALITAAAERKPDLHIIGMSATPVINNLQEGKSLVELITGVHHNELDIRPTLPNCMRLHQRLVSLGIRWKPEYNLSYEQLEIPVDCEEFLEDIRALGRNGTPLELEKILTRARLPIIRRHIKPKTLIYTHYIQGIDKLLRDALIEDGWNVGFYTGEVDSDSRANILEGFLNGNVDVLIGSSAIGTGVDGLQQVCNQLIINVLPWTHAEFEQLKGRIYRQGQRQDKVTLIIPLTYADVKGDRPLGGAEGNRWSWCDSKMQRLRFKKSIADAAVDGIVPEGHLRTPAQAYQDIMAWLERLETGQVEAIARPKIVIPLPDDDPADVQRRQHRYGDFSTLNRLWNQSRSDTTHQRLQANSEEWMQYHTLYQESRKSWAIIPYEEMIRWCQQRSGYTIGDFGCGEAKLAEAVSDRHTVYSFDHIAINNNVVACDMAHVPLNDEELDVAIFSLSLMGSNFTDYLREAHRTLKLDGQLHIIEATSRFKNLARFHTDLETLGFAVISIQQIAQFTHIRSMKIEAKARKGSELRF